jgi:hypothetical protein
MYQQSKIDLFFESLMIWATTGRVCEDLYFEITHYSFHVLAALNCRWLPFIRQAETQLKPHDERLYPHYTWIERLGRGWSWPALLFIAPVVITVAIATIIPFPSVLALQTYAPSESSTILAGYLKTIATVLATLSALLLTVIALTIHVKTSSLRGADFLLNAVVKRRGFLPVAAFLSGTILTALVGMLLSNGIIRDDLNDYTFVTALFSFGSLLILVNLL